MLSNWRSFISVFVCAVLSLSVLLFSVGTANAGVATSRKLTLGSSVASASTTYTFQFVLPSSTVLQSAEFQICTTASGSCSTPAGFGNGSSTLSSQPTNLGDASGWTVNTSTAGSLRLSKSGNSAAPTGTTTVAFGNVTNPSATNATFYARMTTYSNANWTGAVDTGTFAASTAAQVTVTASVDETLTFTLGSQNVSLGTLTPSTTGSGTSTMSASTNAASGYAITISGSTLSSGGNQIAAMATTAPSSQGTGQFGINLRDNATPNVGSDPSGGSGAAASNYNTVDQFRFVSGETVASASGATNTTSYTVSYIANISATQPAGSYSTTLTYIATATF
jgi:hypothetical protein